MASFKEMAQKAKIGSPIMEGKTKITTEELISRFPNGVTIVAFDAITYGDKAYYAFNIREDSTIFVNGGKGFSKIADIWVGSCNGDVKEASEGLAREGGVRFKITAERTKSGNKVYAYNTLDE